MLEKDRISYFYDGTFAVLPVPLFILTIRCKTLALAAVGTRNSYSSSVSHRARAAMILSAKAGMLRGQSNSVLLR
jgi:hypothetical protein